MTTYSALAADVLAELRARCRNHHGTSAVRRRAEGGEPVRCCLTDARPGEDLILASVDLGLPASSPYAGTSPVYVHAAPGCTMAGTHYPSAWVGRRQVLRAYDEGGLLLDALVHRSDTPARLVEQLLAREGVARVLSFNVAHGCYMFTARR